MNSIPVLFGVFAVAGLVGLLILAWFFYRKKKRIPVETKALVLYRAPETQSGVIRNYRRSLTSLVRIRRTAKVAPIKEQGQKLWKRAHAPIYIITLASILVAALVVSSLVWWLSSSTATDYTQVESTSATAAEHNTMATIVFFAIVAIFVVFMLRSGNNNRRINSGAHKRHAHGHHGDHDEEHPQTGWAKFAATTAKFWEKTVGGSSKSEKSDHKDAKSDKKKEEKGAKGHLVAFPVFVLLFYYIIAMLMRYGTPQLYEPWGRYWGFFWIVIPLLLMLVAFAFTLKRLLISGLALAALVLVGVIAHNKYEESNWWKAREAKEIAQKHEAEAKREKQELARTQVLNLVIEPGGWREFKISREWKHAFDPRGAVEWFTDVNRTIRPDGPDILTQLDPGARRVFYRTLHDEPVPLTVTMVARK